MQIQDNLDIYYFQCLLSVLPMALMATKHKFTTPNAAHSAVFYRACVLLNTL